MPQPSELTVVNYVRQIGAGGKFIVLAPPAGAPGGVVVFSDFTRDTMHDRILKRWRADTAPARPELRPGMVFQEREIVHA